MTHASVLQTVSIIQTLNELAQGSTCACPLKSSHRNPDPGFRGKAVECCECPSCNSRKNPHVVSAPDQECEWSQHIFRLVEEGDDCSLRLALSGIDPTVVRSLSNEYGQRLVHVSSSRGHLTTLKWLCEKYGVVAAALEEKDRAGHTPLALAAKFGHLDVLEWIKSRDLVCLDRVESCGRSLYHTCAKFGRHRVIPWLREHAPKLDVNAQDRKGNTPLHLAAKYGHLATVHVLLSLGADLSRINEHGQRACDAARDAGHEPCREYLYCYEAGQDACLQLASCADDNLRLYEENHQLRAHCKLLSERQAQEAALANVHESLETVQTQMLRKVQFLIEENQGLKQKINGVQNFHGSSSESIHCTEAMTRKSLRQWHSRLRELQRTSRADYDSRFNLIHEGWKRVKAIQRMRPSSFDAQANFGKWVEQVKVKRAGAEFLELSPSESDADADGQPRVRAVAVATSSPRTLDDDADDADGGDIDASDCSPVRFDRYLHRLVREHASDDILLDDPVSAGDSSPSPKAGAAAQMKDVIGLKGLNLTSESGCSVLEVIEPETEDPCGGGGLSEKVSKEDAEDRHSGEPALHAETYSKKRGFLRKMKDHWPSKRRSRNGRNSSPEESGGQEASTFLLDPGGIERQARDYPFVRAPCSLRHRRGLPEASDSACSRQAKSPSSFPHLAVPPPPHSNPDAKQQVENASVACSEDSGILTLSACSASKSDSIGYSSRRTLSNDFPATPDSSVAGRASPSTYDVVSPFPGSDPSLKTDSSRQLHSIVEEKAPLRPIFSRDVRKASVVDLGDTPGGNVAPKDPHESAARSKSASQEKRTTKAWYDLSDEETEMFVSSVHPSNLLTLHGSSEEENS